MNYQWKTLVSKLLVGTVVLQASLLNVVWGAETAYAAEAPVVLNEISPSGDWVELYATGDVNFDVHSWAVLADSGQTVALTGTMTAGSFNVVAIPTGSLDDASGWVKLTHNGADADRITWGAGFGGQLPGVVGLNTLARSTDGAGTWVSNVDATEGASNSSQITTLPPVPTVVEVGISPDNSVNVINQVTDADVSVRASFSGTAELAAVLVDTAGRTTDIKDTLGTAVDAAVVEHLNAEALADGTVLARAYTEVNGIRSTWASATATKDTVAPAVPTDPTVRAGAQNGTNVVNSTNVADVRISGGAMSADTTSLAITLDDGPNDVAATLPADGSQGIDARTLDDGALELTVIALDAAGNSSAAASTSVIVKDTVAPAAATSLSGRNASGYVVLSWTASVASDMGSYRIYGDRATGSTNWTAPLGEVSASETTFTTMVLPNGTNRLTVRAVDRLGNEELLGVSTTVVVAGALNEAQLSASNRTLDLIDPLRLFVRVAPETKNAATISVLNNSSTNPTSVSLPTGHVAVGKYLDLSTDNDTVFPLEIRLYYTQADLDAGKVTDERQLEGIRFYSPEKKSWELYGKTGANTADVTVGNVAFAGYIWAFADHLTPIVGSADIAAPERPSNLVAHAADTRVKLTWDRMDKTAGYLVEYATADAAPTAYSRLSVSGGDVTSVTIGNLKNDTAYTFRVASFDWVGNQSAFSTVQQTPSAAGTQADYVVSGTSTKPTSTLATDAGVALTGNAVGGGSLSDTDAIGGQNDGGETDASSTDDTSGDIKGGTDDQSNAANTRTLVTILIIVIAAAAGFGGYYGYQWWMTKPESATQDTAPTAQPEEPKKPKAPRAERSGRW